MSDIRSVGELLLDADYTARLVLFHPGADHAIARVRRFPELVYAGHRLWHALPGEKAPQMDQIRRHALGLAITGRQAAWLHGRHHDEHLDLITATFTRAADLVRRHGHEVDLSRDDVVADLQAARMRVMHTVYLTAHAVTVSVTNHGRRWDEQDTPQTLQTRHRDAARVAAVAGLCELAANDYIDGGYVRILHGEHADPPQDLTRLVRAADLLHHQTRAALTGPDPQPGDLHTIAVAHAALFHVSATLLTAGSPDSRPAGLPTAVAEAGAAWEHHARQWRPLLRPDVPIAAPVRAAAAEIRAAIHDLTITGAGYAGDPQIRDRIDPRQARVDLRPVWDQAAGVADQLHTIARDARLLMPSRSLTPDQRRTENDDPTHGAALSPRDLLLNRPVPIPSQIRDALTGGARTALAATHYVIASAADQAPTPARTQGLVLSLGRRDHERTPPHLKPAATRGMTP